MNNAKFSELYIIKNFIISPQINVHLITVHICGKRDFTAELDLEKSIEPPPYPQDYGNVMECWYTLSAPENTKIRF